MDLRKRFPYYSKLLYLYPASYRHHYSEQMLQTLADMLDDAPSQPQRLAVWSRAISDLPISVLRQQITYTGEIMAHETPRYVKGSALVGAVMLVPFFLLFATASVDNGIEHSVFWHFHVLFTCFIVLPTLAFLLAAVAFTSWIVERHQHEHKSWLHELFDLRRNWQLLSVLVIGLGIVGMVYGHDSVHCVTGNPVREVRQWHQTWQCIEQK